MRVRPLKAIATTLRGITTAIRARRKVFWGVALGVFALNLFLPVAVLSVFRKPVDFFAFNPWLSKLPEWLGSNEVPLGRKLKFLSEMAVGWFISENPIEGVEWGFIVDIPSLGRFIFTAFLFGAYFALWFYRRDQLRYSGWGARTTRYGAAGGALTSVFGFSTGACSVMGCGVPVLPVVGLAFTGVTSGTLQFFATFARVATAVVLLVMTLGVSWFGWLVGAAHEESRPLHAPGA